MKLSRQDGVKSVRIQIVDCVGGRPVKGSWRTFAVYETSAKEVHEIIIRTINDSVAQKAGVR